MNRLTRQTFVRTSDHVVAGYTGWTACGCWAHACGMITTATAREYARLGRLLAERRAARPTADGGGPSWFVGLAR